MIVLAVFIVVICNVTFGEFSSFTGVISV